MDTFGYAGTILQVDLTSGKVTKEPLDSQLVEKFIGGYGINNKLAYDLIPPELEPLAPQNWIIIGTGPFSGTIVPGSSQLFVTTKFPINGAYTTGCAGGSFALMLKTSGYDHVLITGRAQKPVYLRIRNDEVELADAGNLWGLDGYETTDALQSLHQPCSVLPIGPAGENLVKISITAIDKGGTVGNAGFPAVMGSKNLKAIVAQLGTSGVKVHDHSRLQRVVDQMLERVMSYRLRETLLEGGTFAMTHGDSPLVQLHTKVRRPLACVSCPMADKERDKLTEGEYAGMVTYFTHFMITRDWPSTSPEDLHDKNIKYYDVVNRYGVDEYSFTQVKDFVLSLYQQGIITKEDTGGLELNNDFDTTLKLARMTAHKEGFGAILAEGIVGAAKRIGRGAENQAVHMKGHKIWRDPRLSGMDTLVFASMVNPARSQIAAGNCGIWAPGRPVEQFVRQAEVMGISEEAQKRIFGPSSFNIARLTKHTEDWYSLFNCLGLCNRLYIQRFYDAGNMAELYAAVTGIEVTPADLLKAAERAWNLCKVLNVRVGFSRKDDIPPETWFKHLKFADKEFSLRDYYGNPLGREDVERLLDDYYDERGWDVESGIPTIWKLEDLGLKEQADDLGKIGTLK